MLDYYVYFFFIVLVFLFARFTMNARVYLEIGLQEIFFSFFFFCIYIRINSFCCTWLISGNIRVYLFEAFLLLV